MKLLGISFREKISEYAVLARVDAERFQVLETGDLHGADAFRVLKTYGETGVTVGIETVGDADFPTRAAAAVRERCQGGGIDTHAPCVQDETRQYVWSAPSGALETRWRARCLAYGAV